MCQTVFISPSFLKDNSPNIEITVENSYLSACENFVFLEMQSKGETIPEDGTQIMYYPAVFGNNSSSSVASSTLSIPPNFGEFEIIHILSSTLI